MADTDKLVEQLSGLSVLEIAGLVKQLEEKWGVSAAAPVAVAAPAAGAGGSGRWSRSGRGGRRGGSSSGGEDYL
jgi:large subunit ribosomal protein L7/L12